MITDIDWERAGDIIKRRRLHLGLTQEEAAALSGGSVSTANWRVIEKGVARDYREPTLRGIGKALGWPQELWTATFATGRPEEVEQLVTGVLLAESPRGGMVVFGDPDERPADPRLIAITRLLESGCSALEDALGAFRQVLDQLRVVQPSGTPSEHRQDG